MPLFLMKEIWTPLKLLGLSFLSWRIEVFSLRFLSNIEERLSNLFKFMENLNLFVKLWTAFLRIMVDGLVKFG